MHILNRFSSNVFSKFLFTFTATAIKKEQMTGTSDFIRDYREAFGEKAPLPILFYYSDTPVASPENTNGCMFKLLVKAKQGQNITLSKDTVTCGGGRHYAGFAPLQERVYTFVSEKERYKATPKDVAEYVAKLDVQLTDKKYLNFVRIDHAVSFDNMEGLLFFANPDILSGLATCRMCHCNQLCCTREPIRWQADIRRPIRPVGSPLC